MSGHNNDPNASPPEGEDGARLQAVAETVSALCDGYATTEEIERLSETLGKDRSALRYYVECVGLHSALDWLVTSREPFGFVEQEDRKAAVADRDGRPRVSLRRRAAVALAIAASLVAAVWLGGQGGIAPDKAGAVVASCASVTRVSEGAQWSVLRSTGSPSIRPEIMPGETVHLTSGELLIRFEEGAEVTLTAPAVLQVVAADRALAVRGKLTALVNEEAVGFSIDTPRAQVIDLGTRFGLEVDDLGQTDVVVFEGEVDIAYGPVVSRGATWKRRVMRMGEAVRVDDQGDASRIFSINSSRFASAADAPPLDATAPTIVDVRDNIRGDESWNYYEVVHGGMGEDAPAFVDRVAHEWNGLQESGMPAYLVGGDYIRMFNNDKWAEGFEMKVALGRPATIYVLFDDRVPVPDWLLDGFTDTGDDIGMDRGPFHNFDGKLNDESSAGVGPGVSVEDSLSVWSKEVPSPGVVTLGDTQTPHNYLNMYGIVAVSSSDSHPER